MSSHECFLQAILSDPEDDARRLVYADWLDENGDPERAELIRVQCELAPGVEDGERLVALKTRERALCRANGERWLGPLWSDITTRFECGMACLLLTLSEFHSKKVQKSAPEWFVRGGVQELSVHGPSRLLSTAAVSPLLARLHTLSLVCATVHDENAKQLAASPHVSNLRSLAMKANHLGEEGLAALTSASSLSRLTSLRLDDFHLGVGGVRAVLESPHLANLTDLDLSYHGRRRAQDFASLADCIGLRRLRRLNLHGNKIGPASLRALVNSGNLTELIELNLGLNPLGDEGCRVLAGTQGLGRLQRLRASCCGVSVSGARELIGAAGLPALSELDLSFNRINESGIEALASLPQLGRLQTLRLGGQHLLDPGARALAASPPLGRLKELDLSFCQFSANGIRALANSPNLSNLRLLNLDHSCPEPCADAVTELASARGLPRLARLCLSGWKIEDAGRAALQARFGGRALLQWNPSSFS